MAKESKTRVLYEKYAQMIYRIAVSYCRDKGTAEDMVQEVFLRYLRSKPEFQNAEHEKAWFIRVAINCCKTQVMGNWSTLVHFLEDGWREEVEMPLLEDQEDEVFFQCIRKLSKKYRMVLYFRYYEEYTVKEIAEILNVSSNVVSARLKRAKERMKRNLEQEMEGTHEIEM